MLPGSVPLGAPAAARNRRADRHDIDNHGTASHHHRADNHYSGNRGTAGHLAAATVRRQR